MGKKIETTDEIANMFESIENKLRETGKLTTLTGDNESDVSMSFEDFDDGCGQEWPYVVVRIESDKNPSPTEGDLEAFRDFISDKLIDFESGFSGKSDEIMCSSTGEVILINGKKVY